jgi:hypothetical protein
MLMRLGQMAIMIAAIWANIYFGWTTNGYLAATWGFCAAYALTIFPVQIYEWRKNKDIRAAEYASKRAAGLPYGWRRHLPGAYSRATRGPNTGK